MIPAEDREVSLFSRNACAAALCLLAAIPATAPAQSQPLTLGLGTSVGSPASLLPGGSGDGQISAPAEVAFDASRNVYVLDRGNSRIQKLAADGTYLAQWGGNTVHNASGIAIGNDGRVYVSLVNNGLYANRIDRYEADLTGRTQFATVPFNPRGIAVDPTTGHLWLAGGTSDTLREYLPDGTLATTFGSAGNGPGQFDNPADVAFENDGTMYVSDYDNNRVQKFDADGVWGLSWAVQSPGGIAADSAGNVYVVSSHQVHQFSTAGVAVAVLGTNLGGSSLGQFTWPAGLQTDPSSGDLYVADSGNNRVQKLTSEPLGALAYTENDAAKPVAPVLTVDGSSNLASAEVRISAGYVASEDALGFADQNGITGAYADGVLTLTGTASMASWQTALRSVTYRNSSDDPSVASRTVSIRVVDSGDSSEATTRAVTITPVDDAVTAITTASPLASVPGAAATAIDPGLTLSDPDAETTITSASVSILSYGADADPFDASEDELAFAGIGSITGTYNSTYGSLYLSGAGTLGEYQAALRTVTYRNSNAATTSTDRRLSFTIGWGYGTAGLRLVQFVHPPAGGTPTVAGVRRSGQQLTASPGTWSSSTSVTFAYRWQRSDSAGGFADIGSATGETYTLTEADAGHEVRVQVTATNAEAAANATSHAVSVRAALAAPSIGSAPAATTTGTSAQFVFTGEAGAAFECRVDDDAFAPCASPATYSGIGVGAHEFAVRQTDTAANPGPAAIAGWTVTVADSAPAPEPALIPAPELAHDPNAGAKLDVSGRGRLVVDCTIGAGSLEKCSVDAYVPSATRSPGRVLVGHGEAAVPNLGQRTVPVNVVLNERGRHELARHPEGLSVTFDIAAKPYDTVTVSHSSTERTLLAKAFRVAPAHGQFAFDNARLSASVKRSLRTLHQAVGNVARVRCDGHASSRERDRRALGFARARAACRYLRTLGMTANTVVTSYGFRRGRQSNATLTGRVSNRRVVLRVTR